MRRKSKTLRNILWIYVTNKNCRQRDVNKFMIVVLKENQTIKIENQQNFVSRNKLMDELNMIHESFRED